MPKYNVVFREEQHWLYTFTVEGVDSEDAYKNALAKWEAGEQSNDSCIEDAFSDIRPEFVEKLED